MDKEERRKIIKRKMDERKKGRKRKEKEKDKDFFHLSTFSF